MTTHETTIRVRYAETDQMGVVYYANFMVWFEVARGAYCREHGIDYNQVEADGMAMPIVDAHCKYKKSAKYDDEITLKCWVAERRRSSLHMHYEVLRGDELLAVGETVQVLINKTTGRPITFPAYLTEVFQPIETA